MPHLATLVTALYDCEYAKFFAALPELELLLLKDRYLSRHTRYLVRELRVLVYTQFLDAYQTVTLASMAAAFGISVAFCDAELVECRAGTRLGARRD